MHIVQCDPNCSDMAERLRGHLNTISPSYLSQHIFHFKGDLCVVSSRWPTNITDQNSEHVQSTAVGSTATSKATVETAMLVTCNMNN